MMIDPKFVCGITGVNAFTDQNSVGGFLAELARFFPLQMATIWKINTTSNTVSALARIGHDAPRDVDHEFVHQLDGSLVGSAIELINSGKHDYIEIPDIRKHPLYSNHMAKMRVEQLDLRRLIVVPIANYALRTIGVAYILNMYINRPISDMPLEETLRVVMNKLSNLLSTATIVEQTEITDAVLKVYERFESANDASGLLKSLVGEILIPRFNVEACSIYLWKPYDNKFSVAATTGLRAGNGDDFFGHGLAGEAAAQKRIIIVNDAEDEYSVAIALGKQKPLEHLLATIESTARRAKTLMAAPIYNPSRRNDVIGIVTFTNKKSRLGNAIDYFDWEDSLRASHVCRLLSFHMGQILHEESRNAFALRMAHEMLSPSVAILSTSERLIRYFDDDEAISRNKRKSYLNSISENARLQVALARAVEFGWKRSEFPRFSVYKVKRSDLRNIIEDAKRIAIPLCRSERIQFSDIKIHGSFPNLHVDKFAFTQVFFNLFTNAIKYRDRNFTSDIEFGVEVIAQLVTAEELPGRLLRESGDSDSPHYTKVSGWFIYVRDFGVGIDHENREKIFNVGYRVPGSERWSVRGSGIGLSVVRNIIEDFFGAVWLAKSRGPTTFKIFLPSSLESDTYTTSNAWRDNSTTWEGKGNEEDTVGR